jgi:hypothetical protein
MTNVQEVIHTTDDVFGVARDLPLNYVTRESVDGKFIDSLARNQHIVIYGSSKQGKTSLRKKCLEDSDYIVISCQNRWSLAELNTSILKECGFSVKQSTEKSVSGKHKIVAEIEGKGKIPFITEARAQGGYEYERESEIKDILVPLELDPEDTNDIIRALEQIEFKKYIALEDFHYLPDDTQRDFSFALKTFHEKSKISFIIVGVWREENRLIGFNGDLTDRVLSVDVDTWEKNSLTQVITEGGNLLNVQFDQNFVETLLLRCFNSVHLVQEVCRRVCRAEGVTETQGELKIVGRVADVGNLISDVVSEQAARYRGFLSRFADGFQETDLEMPKWIIFALLCSTVSQMESGLRLRRISKLIKSAHPRKDGLNNGNITQALNSVMSLQNKKGTRPLVIDYDSANTSLHVVDKGFFIWLASQNIEDVLEDLELPKKIELPE